MYRIMSSITTAPGAKLYYQVQGRGPLLLMLTGGSGSADSFNALVPYLQRNYTVLTYDRRGYSRSPLDHPQETGAIPIETQCADAEKLLEVLNIWPACLFGSSYGALIALELLQRNSQQLQQVIAHEPPLLQVLPSEKAADLTFRTDESPDETLHRFAASLGIQRGRLHSKPGNPSQIANDQFFLKHEAPAVEDYEVNFAKLFKFRNQLTFGGGSTGRDYFPYRCAQLAASQSKVSFVEFPGKHNGFGVYPEKFARVMKDLLSPMRVTQPESVASS
jgi:pimeloyl-ACP methyl ester carboxylesterase